MSFITIQIARGREEMQNFRPFLRAHVELVAHDGQVFSSFPIIDYDAHAGRHTVQESEFDGVVARAISHVAEATGIDEIELEDEYRDPLQRELVDRVWPRITGVMNRRCLAIALWHRIFAYADGGEYVLEIPGMGPQRFLDYEDALQAAHFANKRSDGWKH